MLKGGDNGPAIVPGEPGQEPLIEAVRLRNPDLQMPPKGKLPDAAIADLVAWVKAGAIWPARRPRIRDDQFDVRPRRSARPSTGPGSRSAAATPPAVQDARLAARTRSTGSSWRSSEAKGLKPAPPADRRVWLRRVTFDLIGLPPTPAEVEAFLADTSPEAVARVVDRLLQSPHFGERWGRHWLDLVRYAETRGHEFDSDIPNAYQYRDYVIRALNADVPYDQFVIEHSPATCCRSRDATRRDGFNESILGTGFWFLGEEVHSPVDIRQDQADRFDNRIDVLTKTFLGLTVACARCHDHKFDAISTKDYYALLRDLRESGYRQVRFDTLDQNRKIAAELDELE